MKKMLVFDPEEKEIIRKASALMHDYCDEMCECCECEDCPFDNLCTRIQNSDRELNLPITFAKVTEII